MRLRTWLAAGCLVLAASDRACAVAGARELTVAVDPVLRDAVRQAYLDPFSLESGLSVAEPVWHPGLDALHEAAGDWDMVLADRDTLEQGCAAGLLERLDVAKMFGRDRFIVAATDACSVPGLAWGTVLAWDRDKFQGVPSWADFWDVAKHPGKRGLLRGARQTLELALLGDGVAPGDVYALLRTGDGVDRAFRRLDQLRPYIVWYGEAADAADLIGSGSVLLTSADSRVIEGSSRAGHAPLGAQWDRSLLEVESWALLKAGPNIADAEHLLSVASDPTRQAALVALVPWVAVTRPAVDDPAAAAARPNLATALPIDEQFWRDNAPRLEQRFREWLSK